MKHSLLSMSIALSSLVALVGCETEQETATLSGRVISSDDSRPVPSAQVQVKSANQTTSALTNSSGNFEIIETLTAQETYRITITKEGFRESSFSKTLQPGANVEEIVLQRSVGCENNDLKITGPTQMLPTTNEGDLIITNDGSFICTYALSLTNNGPNAQSQLVSFPTPTDVQGQIAPKQSKTIRFTVNRLNFNNRNDAEQIVEFGSSNSTSHFVTIQRDLACDGCNPTNQFGGVCPTTIVCSGFCSNETPSTCRKSCIEDRNISNCAATEACIANAGTGQQDLCIPYVCDNSVCGANNVCLFRGLSSPECVPGGRIRGTFETTITTENLQGTANITATNTTLGDWTSQIAGSGLVTFDSDSYVQVEIVADQDGNLLLFQIPKPIIDNSTSQNLDLYLNSTYYAGIWDVTNNRFLSFGASGALQLTEYSSLTGGRVAGNVDMYTTPADLGVDIDGGFDAGIDGGFDAGVDGGFDAGVDGGFDAGTGRALTSDASSNEYPCIDFECPVGQGCAYFEAQPPSCTAAGLLRGSWSVPVSSVANTGTASGNGDTINSTWTAAGTADVTLSVDPDTNVPSVFVTIPGTDGTTLFIGFGNFAIQNVSGILFSGLDREFLAGHFASDGTTLLASSASGVIEVSQVSLVPGDNFAATYQLFMRPATSNASIYCPRLSEQSLSQEQRFLQILRCNM